MDIYPQQLYALLQKKKKHYFSDDLFLSLVSLPPPLSLSVPLPLSCLSNHVVIRLMIHLPIIDTAGKEIVLTYTYIYA